MITTTAAEHAAPLLELRGLTLDLAGADSQPGLVDDVSFTVAATRTVALIGESGCGKTMTAMAVLSLLPPAIHVAGGEILFQGRNLLALSNRELRRVRGAGIGMVFQDPMSSLNPTMTVGRQLVEARQLHLDESREKSRAHARELLERVGVPNAAKRLDAYPYELSGGMQQRVMIAQAIACDPALLIADEPTTALDVTIQAEILELLAELQRDMGMGVLLVTHDLGVVADFADEVVAMYAGHVIETGGVEGVFAEPQHPYTAALLGSMPQGATPRTPLVAVGGRVPPAGLFPTGCRFRTRCPFVAEVCDSPTAVVPTRQDHTSRCHRVQLGEISVERQRPGPTRQDAHV